MLTNELRPQALPNNADRLQKLLQSSFVKTQYFSASTSQCLITLSCSCDMMVMLNHVQKRDYFVKYHEETEGICQGTHGGCQGVASLSLAHHQSNFDP